MSGGVGATAANPRPTTEGDTLALRRFVWGWLLLTALCCLFVHQRARIDRAPPPPEGAAPWAMAALEAARIGATLPEPPAEVASYRGRGPVIALAWWKGRVQARHVGGADFAGSVRAAAKRFASDENLGRLQALSTSSADGLRYSITVARGQGPLLGSIPLLSSLSLVPLVEGVSAELDGRRAHLTPDEILAAGLYDAAVRTPIPDLSFGADQKALAAILARELAVDTDLLLERGSLRRFAATTLLREPYPREQKLDRAALERAAREGAEFLLRHQESNGRYTYVYGGQQGSALPRGYNMPRHAGTTYFLAQAHRLLDMPEAREGARRALRWVRDEAGARCGGPELWCVRQRAIADIGAAALTALAASEVLTTGADAAIAEQLQGLNAFIRSMQREDGELMHVYDLRARKPIDVQKMYYSGEAAYALLLSQRVAPDARDLETAKRLMGHLTGGAWGFFGSRYFYGEEHWTCQAAASAAPHMDVDEALAFCMRWLDFQRVLQYRPGQTPWPVAGAIGVGPVILPRITAVASRVEAGAQIYRVARDRGLPVGELRRQLEATLSLLLRMRWSPGPVHVLADPAAALGGFPATQASLEVRNDFVQHAGSAMLLWAEILREEEQQGR